MQSDRLQSISLVNNLSTPYSGSSFIGQFRNSRRAHCAFDCIKDQRHIRTEVARNYSKFVGNDVVLGLKVRYFDELLAESSS